MAPNLARVRDEGSQSDLREGIYESSHSVVERQELDLAVDSFDYCIFGETIEEIRGLSLQELILRILAPKKEPRLGFQEEFLVTLSPHEKLTH